MGHTRVGALPAYPKWRKVVELLDGDAGTARIAAATIDAAQRGLQLAAGDEGLCHTLWLLTQITLAAREREFAAALNQAGVPVPKNPGVLDVVGGFADAVDRHLRQTYSRTDIGEMAQLAAAESLTALCSERAASLFGVTPADVKMAVRSFSTRKGFGTLAHDFFSRLTQRYLAYHLSRELSNHVGDGKRFANVYEHTEFVERLGTHCRQAAVIVRDFAGGWYSKTSYETGITPRQAKAFIHVALKKIRGELKRRGAEDVS